MKSPPEYRTLMEEGIWKLNLDKGHIDEALESFEHHEVTSAVDLILHASDRLNLQLTHSQALRLVRLIEFRKESVAWHELFLEVYSESPQWQYCVLQVAGIFPKISVSMKYSSDMRLPLSSAYAIHHALQYGSRLQELSLSHCVLSDESMQVLTDGIRLPSSPFQRLSLSNVDCISSQMYDVVPNDERHPLALALAENTTLRCIDLRHSMIRNRGVIFSMINALIGSNGLEDLSLEGTNLASTVRVQEDDIPLMLPLTKLLMDPQCGIRNLDLANCGLGQRGCRDRNLLQSLLPGLQQNTSVKSVDLSENGFDSMDMTMVLDSLKRIPGIRHVDLNDQGNHFTEGSIHWLKESCLLDPLPSISLEELQIDDYLPDTGDFDYDSENSDEQDAKQKTEIESTLLKLLRNNPSLGKLGIELDEVQDRLSPRVIQMLDLNLCGRRLIVPRTTIQQETSDIMSTACQYGQVPQSLWPIVLERANSILSEYPERCASVLHHLSQNGPFLLDCLL